MPKDPNALNTDWVPTAQAARQLGVSSCTLKRYAHRDGLLQEGTHFLRGPHANTSLVWHLKRCFLALRPGSQR